jgi:hypothetical protein
MRSLRERWVITCGLGAPLRERGTWHVPKQELVMKTYAALAKGQLRIHPKLEHAKLLKHELANYQTKTTESGRNIFAAREGEHDDLIMALCLPTLAASLPFYQLIPTPEEEKAAEVRWQGKIRREMEAMRQEEEAEKTPEQLALEREQSRLEAARQAEETDDVRFGFGWGDDDPPRASWS